MQTILFALCIFAKRMVMRRKIDILKGIHPGKIIARDLKKRNLSQRAFAASIGEHSQTLNAIITGRRNLTTEMSLKIEQSFGYEEGFLLTLQAFYEITSYKNRIASNSVSGVPAIRRSLFWDMNFDTIDWGLYKRAIIARVMERGNEAEKQEIAHFYKINPTTLDSYKPSNAYRINPAKRND